MARRRNEITQRLTPPLRLAIDVSGDQVADVPELSCAFGMVKLAALRANADAGVVPERVLAPLERACTELASDKGDLRGALVVPLLQGGAGTSTNMNVNEVLANRALEVM